MEKVSAKITDGPEVTVDFELDDNIQDAINRYGEDVVMSRYRASLIIDLQSFLRTQMKKESWTPDGIQQAVKNWVPGVKARGRSPAERAAELFSKLSEEEKAQLLEELRSQL
jgi:hypothetical protein